MAPLESGRWGFDPKSFRSIHNCISVVLLVVYGEIRIILGADAQRDSWEHILQDGDRKRSGDVLQCTVVKVSHHGSKGAFHSDVWAQHGTEKPPLGVVTPYTPSRLSRAEIAQRLHEATSGLQITGPDGLSEVPPGHFKSARLRLMSVRRASGQTRSGSTVAVDHCANVLQAERFDVPTPPAGMPS